MNDVRPRVAQLADRKYVEADSAMVSARSKSNFLNPRDYRGSYAPDWLLVSPDLSPGAKLVYVSLLRHFNKHKKMSWPSQGTVGKEVGLSARQVRRHVRELLEIGLVDVTATASSNQYRFPWHELMRGAALKPAAITRDD